MGTAVSLVCALAAAVSYGLGSVLQGAAARREPPSERLDGMLLVRLVRELPYLAGLALDLAGFVATVVALQNLPLFMVQPIIAGSVGVTAVVAATVFHTSLHRAERVALVALVVGFALLAASAQPESASALGTAGTWVLAAGVLVVVVAGATGSRLGRPYDVTALAAAAGLSWAGSGVAARVLELSSPWWHVVVDPVALTLAAYGLLGVFLFAAALQRGAVTAVSAVVFTVETVVPAIVGFVFLGDRTRPGLAVVAVAGIAVTVGAAIALASRAEVAPER
jgi:drug/metabolite transporter (DMT)-like permease